MVPTKDCNTTSCGQTPIIDADGLYESGNDRPAALDSAVLSAMATVSPNLVSGKIDGVVIGDDLGNSIYRGTTQVPAWAATLKPTVRLFNGSTPARHLETWSGTDTTAPGDWLWPQLVAKLAAAGRPADQIQFAMFVAMPSLMAYFTLLSFNDRVTYVRVRALLVMNKVKQYLPNVKTVFIFGGHPYMGYYGGEPFIHDVDWGWQQALLQQDSACALSCWGNSVWADGMTPRSDGLYWPCSDFGSGGHLIDGAGTVHVVSAVVLPWLQSDPAVASLRR